jgi:putative ABC transport system permease protein
MLLRLTPWRRGPLLLLRRPGVAAALMAAAFVAVLPAAAAPLFLSSSENATLHRQIRETCPWAAGARVVSLLPVVPRFDTSVLDGNSNAPGAAGLSGAEIFQERNRAVFDAAGAGLSPPVVTLLSQVNVEPVGRATPNPDARGVNLVGQDTFRPHVQVTEGPAGAGIWLPDTVARLQGYKIGDRVRLSARNRVSGVEGEPKPYDLPVAAIFRDLRSLPDQPYWCSLRDSIRGVPGQEFGNTPILPVALIDTATFVQAGTDMLIHADHRIEYAVGDETMPAPRGKATADGVARMRDTIKNGDPKLFDQFTFHPTFSSLLDRQVRRAELVRTGLLPPVAPITAAGVLVGLAVVSAAAIFWVQRRRQELTVLAAHGVGPGGLGLKAVFEALPAVLLGSAAGWAGAWLLVGRTGPSPVFSGNALPLSILAAVAIGLVALVLIGLVSAGRTRALTDQSPATRAKPPATRAGPPATTPAGGEEPDGSRRQLSWPVSAWRRLPWELLLLAAAPLAWLALADSTTADNDGPDGVGEVAHVPARLLVVPILVIAGTALLAARIGAASLRRRGLGTPPRPPARLLAWRRVVRDATAAAVLASATAVPIAMAAYGASVTDSIRTTSDAEARMLLGSDVIVAMEPGSPPPAVPATLAERATSVIRANGEILNGVRVDVLFVDPTTFGRGAFWDSRIDGPTLENALSQLTAGPTPTVVASSRIGVGPGTLSALRQEYAVTVGDVRMLPGEQSGYPVVLAHKDLLRSESLLPLASPQLWIRGDPAEVRPVVTAARLPLVRISTIDDQRGGSVHEPVTYTFQYLIALSIFTGLIAVVGLLLFLESRTAAHRRAYVLLRRLGLRAGAHRRALIMELGAPVLVGLVGGLALAGGLAYGLGDSFEIDTDSPPGTLLALPVVMIAVICATAVGITLGAASLAHQRIRRARPSEVLRDTP